jgi:phosphoglucomutase
MTLSAALGELYRRYGYYLDLTHDIYMEGLDGIERRTRMMRNLRENSPKEIGGQAVVKIGDYLLGEITDLKTGKREPTNLPKSDVLSFETACGDKILVRPSGTEPKVKIYLLTHADAKEALTPKMDAYLQDCKRFAD